MDVVQTYPLVKVRSAVSVSAHVLARAPTREGWEETHVLVVSGNGTHVEWAAATNPVLFGGVERLGAGTVVEDD